MIDHVPHYKSPSCATAYLLILYRNFSRSPGYNFSHIGLGVNAIHTAKVLRRHHVRTDIAGVWTLDHVREEVAKRPTLTHVLIEAPWIAAKETADLMRQFPDVHFIVRSHSQVGFLQVEPGAIRILQDLGRLQEMELNFTLAANSLKFSSFCRTVWKSRCEYLPNLYDLERPLSRPSHPHGDRLLRISSFGALRLLKNHTSAAATAMLIAEADNRDLEFYVSVNREEHGQTVLNALREIFRGNSTCKLVESPWSSWPEFRRLIGTMDLCIQLSASETFNLSTADAVSEGVPVVVSSAIEWVPPHWQVCLDTPDRAAHIGLGLLRDRHAPAEGLHALERFCKEGERIWLAYLGGQP
jgi:hypothetical protein